MALSITSHLLADLRAVSAVTDVFTTIEHRYESDLTSFDFTDAQQPALILFPGEETTEPNEHNGYVAQMMTRHIHCVIVAEHSMIDDLKDLVRATSLGWQHNSLHDLSELLTASPLKQVGQSIYWLDSYISRAEIRQS